MGDQKAEKDVGDDPYEKAFCSLRCSDAVVEHIIDHIICLGSAKLYEKYIIRKCAPFAVECFSEMLLSHVDMAFVRIDSISKDEPARWISEEAPLPPAQDSFARAVVPIVQRPPQTDTTTARDGQCASTVSDRLPPACSPVASPSRKDGWTPHATSARQSIAEENFDPLTIGGDPLMADGLGPPSGDGGGNRVPSWEDEEEEALRCMKERELKRMKDQDDRKAKKSSKMSDDDSSLAAATQRASLLDEKGKGRSARKGASPQGGGDRQITFDSEGKPVKVVGGPPSCRLSANMPFKFSSAPSPVKTPQPDPSKAKARPNRTHRAALDHSKDSAPLPPRETGGAQPSALDSLILSPGVSIKENGKTKSGPEPPRDTVRLTPAAYAALGSGVSANRTKSLPTKPQMSVPSRLRPLPGGPVEPIPEGRDADPERTRRTRRESAGSAVGSPSAAAASAPQKRPDGRTRLTGGAAKGAPVAQPPPPPPSGSKRRTRERPSAISGSVRHEPPPPVGATMGHGAVGSSDNFYFP